MLCIGICYMCMMYPMFMSCRRNSNMQSSGPAPWTSYNSKYSKALCHLHEVVLWKFVGVLCDKVCILQANTAN